MVIGDRFAWGHLEKTAGDATLELFLALPEIVRFADPRDTHEKHAYFPQRERDVSGKVLALNIRRLPAWVLSKAQHEARYGTYPDYEPGPMASPVEMAESTDPDQRLAAITGRGRFPVDRWIRTEFLAQDFLAFVSEFIELTPSRRAEIVQLAEAHEASAPPYDHHVDHWFTDTHLRRMYERNPVWAGLERELYGDSG